jgi:predicted RNA binding protein YcfA (HicA-like mRNA interferase family)
MVKPSKLFALLLESSNRDVTYRDFLALIVALGFVHSRTKGSHQSFVHAKCPKLLVVQPRGKDAKRYQVRELLDMIEEYGLALDE